VGSKPAPSVHPGRLFFVTNLWLLLRSVPLGCAEPKPSNDKVSVFLSFVIPAKAHGRQVKGDVPKAKATEESLVQAGWKNQF
jgi:hypothetical protein